MIFETISDYFGCYITPIALLVAGAAVFPSMIRNFLQKCRSQDAHLLKTVKYSRFSSFRALTVALAGTLGVGNITGVASALISGGPGAVFWMWVGAFLVLSVKYAEVHLAVRFARQDRTGRYGGAMYYISDGLGKPLARSLGSFFAVLCCLNSLITGNVIQSNAASAVLSENHRLTAGLLLGALVLVSVLYGTRKIERITSLLIPPLTLFYMVVSLWILFSNAALLPQIFQEILLSAFTPRAAMGGMIGFSVREGMRFGIIRGIFSNEAGCGTSPTAHASAETDSPHRQAVLGIWEVLFDTVILCTLTALVLLIAHMRWNILPWGTDADAASVTLEAFRSLTGATVSRFLHVAVVLFAYATILAQIYYGTVAIRYLSDKKWPQSIYTVLSVLCTVGGSVITAPVMWLTADLLIGIMTATNCVVLILLRRYLSDGLQCPPRRRD